MLAYESKMITSRMALLKDRQVVGFGLVALHILSFRPDGVQSILILCQDKEKRCNRKRCHQEGNARI